MVITLAAHTAETPAGNPVAAPMPVAPVVAIVILGEIAVFTQTVGLDEGAPAELAAFTVIAGLVVTLKFSSKGTNTELAVPEPIPEPVNVTVAVPAA